jgi:deazaflavin-dependent oxidoreductase (nitroreductase family)
MSFDTPAGTRGGRQPAGWVFRWGNKLMARRIRRKGGGKFMGFDALVLTTIGRKSGLERTNPVGWFPGKDGGWLIVASANGAIGNPAWYYNIAAHPDQVQIELDGRTIPVMAEQLTRSSASIMAEPYPRPRWPARTRPAHPVFARHLRDTGQHA